MQISSGSIDGKLGIYLKGVNYDILAIHIKKINNKKWYNMNETFNQIWLFLINQIFPFNFLLTGTWKKIHLTFLNSSALLLTMNHKMRFTCCRFELPMKQKEKLMRKSIYIKKRDQSLANQNIWYNVLRILVKDYKNNQQYLKFKNSWKYVKVTWRWEEFTKQKIHHSHLNA